MKKSELAEKIKSIINKVKSTPKQGVGFSSKFDIVNQFPEVGVVLTSLMTDQYEQFIDNIQYVAPKPTTLKIVLSNGQHFFLSYSEKSWTAQIEGKKYYLKEIKSTQLAAESVSRILRYGQQNKAAGKPKDKEAPPETEEAPEETPEA